MYWKFGLVVPYLPPANSLLADKLYDKHLKKLKQEGSPFDETVDNRLVDN